MTSQDILLGYEVGTGKEVFVENTHLLVTGLTNKSGKTTTIQALADRSGRKVLVFATKPGEQVFESEHVIQPFYEEKSDWQYVEAILSAVMKERMRFERAWIIRATKGTKSLKEVDFNCKKFASLSKEGSLENNVFSNLHAYFEIVLPQLVKVSFSETFPSLEVGINVMDLTGMREEVQSLVIRACLDYISHEETGIITVIPELWKFAPEGRGNPVKMMLEFLIRQGATRQNFVWMDSQDLAGVDKLPLKQVYTWLMGLQTERNEVQHTLDQLPLPRKSKPQADSVMTLKVGHFILATPRGVKTVYVMPVWSTEEEAKKVAMGKLSTDKLEEFNPGRAGDDGHGLDSGKTSRAAETIADDDSSTSPPVPETPSRPEPPALIGMLPTPGLEEPRPETKSLASFTLHVTRLISDSLEGKVIHILHTLGRSAYPKEIINEALELGWVINVKNFGRDIAPSVSDGLIMKMENGMYRIPEKVQVVEVAVG